MPDLDCEKNSPYPFLNRLSTETLRQILREDFESEDSGTPENDEFITCVMEVIAQREADDPEFPQFDAAAGWRDFRQNYRLGEVYAGPVCGEAAPEGVIKNERQERQADLKAPRPGRAIQRVLRFAIIAAAVASLCMAAAGAFEMNLFNMVAQWTQDVFQFRSEGAISSDEAYESGVFLEDDQTLKPLLTEAGITEKVCPRWIPEGYTFLEARVFPDEDEPLFIAKYTSESSEQPITVSVVVLSEPKGLRTEKDIRKVAPYVKNDVDHYIMNNNGVLITTWVVGRLDCAICGSISELETETMINSIYEE